MKLTSVLALILFAIVLPGTLARSEITVTAADLVVDSSVARDARDLPVLAFDIAASTNLYTIRTLRFRVEGSIYYDKQIEGAALYADTDSDRKVSAADVLLATWTDPFSDGKIFGTSNLTETIAAHEDKAFVLTFDLSGYPGEYQYLQAILGYVSDQGEEATYYFYDDAESATPAFETVSGWSRDASGAYKGSYLWTESPGGDYGNDVAADLVTPALSLPDSPQHFPSLEFAQRYATEWGIDLCKVQVIDSDDQVTDLAVYSGEQLDWGEVSLSLFQWKGTTIQLRFRFESDRDITGDGWYLDNILVYDSGDNLLPAAYGPRILVEQAFPRVHVEQSAPLDSGDLIRGESDAVLMVLDLEALDSDVMLDRILFTPGNGIDLPGDLDGFRIYEDRNNNKKVDTGDRLVAEESGSQTSGQGVWYPRFEEAGHMPCTWADKPVVHRRRLFTRPSCDPPAYRFDPSTGKWTPIGAGIHVDPEISAGDYIYGVIPDTTSIAQYDEFLDHWTIISSPNRLHPEFRASDWLGHPYVLISEKVAYYSADTRTWIYPPDSASNRYRGGVVSLAHGILVVGGMDSDGSTEIYDSRTNSWSSVGSIHGYEIPILVTSDQDCVYAVGRRSGNYVYERTCDVFDFATNEWRRIADFPAPPNGINAGGILGDVLHVMADDTVYIYEPNLDEWVSIGSVTSTYWGFMPEEGRIYEFPRRSGTFYTYDYLSDGFEETLPEGETRRYLIAADVSDAPDSSDRLVRPSVTSIFAHSLDHSERVLCDVTGNAGAGTQRTVLAKPPFLISEENALPDGENYSRGDTDAEVLAFTLRPENFGSRLRSVTIRSTGSGNEATQITNSIIWSDNDRSGNITPGDHPSSASATFELDDGLATFAFPTDWPVTELGNESSYLLTYDFTGAPGPGALFEPRIDSIDAVAAEYPNETVYFGGAPGSSIIKLLFSDVTPTPTPATTPSPTFTPAATVVPFERADINNDGIVDYRDLYILSQYWHKEGQ